MVLIVVLIFFVLVPAAAAAALAYGLARLQPGWSLRRRTVVAMLASGLVPIALPIFGVLTNSPGSEAIAAMLALLVAGLVVAIVICLPVALALGRRLAPPPADVSAFD